MIPGTDLHQFDVHNDGYFAYLPLNYFDGVILEMAVPRMSYEQLAEFLEEKCGCYFQETFGRLNLYLGHLEMNLSEYLSQAITYNMDDLVSKKIGPLKKRYCNDFSVDEMVDWAEMEVETEGVEARASITEGVEARVSTTKGVEARTRTKDKGKEKVSEDASVVVETRRYSNPGSTVKLGVTVNPDGKTYFDRFYVCEILTAIGRDGNNHIYPVAWAVVNVENKDNWTWFLELLEEDLGCSRGNGLTLMSDQHKGLIEAVKDVMPNAEHRQCARHIYENFRKQYPGLEYRQLFWAASKASYPQLFNKIMDKIKSANPNALKYLMDKNPKSWSRAFFEVDRGCEAIKNGFSECFNSVIVNVRHKPLLTMLEAIRVIVLERMNKMREISRK
ncbi:multidrug resistance-associated protein 5 [Tanacetum coccineum]